MPDDPTLITPSTPVRFLWPADRLERGQQGTRTLTVLRQARIATVAELTAMSAQDIGDLRGAGDATVDEVRRALAARGLSLKDDGGNAAAAQHARIKALRGAGLSLVTARRFARESWPKGEIAPGIWLEVAGGA